MHCLGKTRPFKRCTYVLKFGSQKTPFQLGQKHYRHVNILGAYFFFTFGCVLVYDYHNGTADMYLRRDDIDEDHVPGVPRQLPWELQ
jgi:hypothetical protein